MNDGHVRKAISSLSGMTLSTEMSHEHHGISTHNSTVCSTVWLSLKQRKYFMTTLLSHCDGNPSKRGSNEESMPHTANTRFDLDCFFHTMDLLWEKFQWNLPLYMKPIKFQSKDSVVCSVTATIFIGFCLKKENVFSQHIGKKTNEYLNSAEQITRNWNVDQLSVLITSWDII